MTEQASEPALSTSKLQAKDHSKKVRATLVTLSIPAIYLLLIFLWDYFGQNVNPYFSSYPRAIIAGGIQMIHSGALWSSLLSSLRVFASGLLLTFLLGIPLGYLIGRYRTLNNIIGPIVTALFVAPREVFIPLLVLWFGLTDMSRVIFVLLSSIFPIIYNVADGVQSVSQAHIDVARAYGASEWQTTREVTLPSIVPFLGIGIKQAIGRGLTGLVAAEFFIGVSGLGGELQKVSALFRLDKAFVIIFVLVMLGLTFSRTGDAIEAYLGRWRKSEKAY